MLGVLIPAQIREYTARSVRGFDVGGNGAYDLDDLGQEFVGCIAEVSQGGHVVLGYDDDVNGPARAGVVEREHVGGFEDDLYLRSPAECFIAVEVVAHRTSVADAVRRRSRFGARVVPHQAALMAVDPVILQSARERGSRR
jgi:hypothetical protein